MFRKTHPLQSRSEIVLRDIVVIAMVIFFTICTVCDYCSVYMVVLPGFRKAGLGGCYEKKNKHDCIKHIPSGPWCDHGISLYLDAVFLLQAKRGDHGVRTASPAPELYAGKLFKYECPLQFCPLFWQQYADYNVENMHRQCTNSTDNSAQNQHLLTVQRILSDSEEQILPRG